MPRLKRLRVIVNLEAPLKKKDLPLNLRELQKIFAVFQDEMKDEVEWREWVESLGRNPNELALSFCDDTQMREYQRQFRRLDRTTDVLSFPLREIKRVGSLFPFTEDPTMPLSLGDLIVSLPAVERGARRGRRSVRRELAEVLLHGGLHLLGCEHVKGGAQAKRMRALQKRLYRKVLPFI